MIRFASFAAAWIVVFFATLFVLGLFGGIGPVKVLVAVLVSSVVTAVLIWRNPRDRLRAET